MPRYRQVFGSSRWCERDCLCACGGDEAQRERVQSCRGRLARAGESRQLREGISVARLSRPERASCEGKAGRLHDLDMGAGARGTCPGGDSCGREEHPHREAPVAHDGGRGPHEGRGGRGGRSAFRQFPAALRSSLRRSPRGDCRRTPRQDRFSRSCAALFECLGFRSSFHQRRALSPGQSRPEGGVGRCGGPGHRAVAWHEGRKAHDGDGLHGGREPVRLFGDAGKFLAGAGDPCQRREGLSGDLDGQVARHEERSAHRHVLWRGESRDGRKFPSRRRRSLSQLRAVLRRSCEGDSDG